MALTSTLRKCLKAEKKTNSESNELTAKVDKCPVEKKSIPPDTRRRRRGESSSCASRKRRRNAEDSGYTSKLEGNEEEKSGNKADQEDVAVVDLCFTSNGSYEARADSKQGPSSVEMVHVALETSISENQDISWCDEASLKQPDSKRRRESCVEAMSFSFSQALISETCPFTQPLGSDGHSQDYERESALTRALQPGAGQ